MMMVFTSLMWIGNADRKKGRFRSFLLGAMNHFLADEWDKARAQKRGGGRLDLPLASVHRAGRLIILATFRRDFLID